jgi:hypothetical protein
MSHLSHLSHVASVNSIRASISQQIRYKKLPFAHQRESLSWLHSFHDHKSLNMYIYKSETANNDASLINIQYRYIHWISISP